MTADLDRRSQLLARTRTFAGLPDDIVGEFAALLRECRFAPGETLVRQGTPSDGAFIIETGEVTVAARLPGGDVVEFSRLGPDDVLGESALVDTGIRSATATATSPVTSFFVDQRDLQILRLRQHRSAIVLLRHLAVTLCERLRATYAQIARTPGLPVSHYIPGGESVAADAPTVNDTYAPFLHLLPCFQAFDREELRDLGARGRIVEVSRGMQLFQAGTVPSHLLVVVHGALEISLPGDPPQRVDVLGPGRLAGHTSIVGGTVPVSCHVREDGAVMLLDHGTMRLLLHEHSRDAFRLMDAIIVELVLNQTKANQHIARLVNHHHIRRLRSG